MSDAPTLVYDDDCGFCTWWAAWAERETDVERVGFAELTDAQRARLPPDFESCAHLLTDEAVYSCGAAVEAVAVRADDRVGDAVDSLREVPGYEAARERLYRWGADRRDLWGRFVREPRPARSVEVPVTDGEE